MDKNILADKYSIFKAVTKDGKTLYTFKFSDLDYRDNVLETIIWFLYGIAVEK